LTYLAGFGNAFESEVVPGALPRGRNTPRLVPFGLYTEQLSGTAFTAPRSENRRTWLYRIQPGVVVGPATRPLGKYFGGVDPRDCEPQVNPLRWKPMPVPRPMGTVTSTSSSSDAAEEKEDFVTGMRLMCTAGDPGVKDGISIYMYGLDASMSSSGKHFYDADGDLLVVPQLGRLEVVTELGRLHVAPNEIFVVPRGIVFQVNLLSDDDGGGGGDDTKFARGYVLECYKGGFHLPELGPIVSLPVYS